MAGLTEEIESQEDAIRYAQDNPNKALGVVIWNLIEVKNQCSCRLKTCRNESKKNRLKNLALQTGGGIVGGAVSVWVYMQLHWSDLVQALKGATDK